MSNPPLADTIQLENNSAQIEDNTLYSEAPTIIHTTAEVWDAKDEKRFDHLLEKSLMERASEAEHQELEQLKYVRQRQLARPTNEELSRSIRERALLSKLTKSLNEYIEFKKATDASAPTPVHPALKKNSKSTILTPPKRRM